jgi:hypothetical protein
VELIDNFKDIKIISLEENSKNPNVSEIFLYSADKIDFNFKSEYHIDGNVLKLVNYSDGLGIPKNVGLEIFGKIYANISGYLTSPAYIQGHGSVNLFVNPESELIVKCMGPSRVDDIMLPPDEDFCEYSYGRDFLKVKREFYSGLTFSKPKIFINKNNVSANFSSEMRDMDDILLCMKMNVVYIEKSSGTTNIYYQSEIEKEYVGGDKTGLEAQLTKAIDEENYEQAKVLQKKLDKILIKQKNPDLLS